MGFSTHIKDYYSIMGLPRNATLDEIKKAFRDKAKEYHPDICKLPDAHERFIEVGEAYEVLKDPKTRREYDALLDEAARSRHSRYKASGTHESTYDRNYRDFRNTQQKARNQAEGYAKMSLEDLITSVLGFAYELGRTILVGERNKPRVTFGDYVKLGLYGITLTICLVLAFTGVGTIPGIIIAKGVIDGMTKDGKFIGIGPLLMSTLIADAIVVFAFFAILNAISS